MIKNPFELNSQLFQILNSLSSIACQNRLMSLKDREIALALYYASENQCQLFLSYLAPKKVKRVQEELNFQKRLAVTKKQYTEAVLLVLKVLETGESKNHLQSFIRPRQNRKD